MPSSSYRLVFRLFLTEGFDLTTRAILDAGSGPTLISRQLLQEDTPLHPLSQLASKFHDVHGGWLPIVGSVCLGVALGGQTSYIFFGVVDNMSVPAILGTPVMDIARILQRRSSMWISSMVPRYQYDETEPARDTQSRQSVLPVHVPTGSHLS